ncbi:MAG: FlgD immunoglobulin-like domain containing protein [candidate division WOR-3 bacterium]
MIRIRNAKYGMRNILLKLPQRLLLLFYCSLLTLLSSLCFGQYRCDWNVFAAGGGFLSSTDFQSKVSVSQTAIGHLTTTDFQAFIGFWQPEPQVGIQENEPEKMPNRNQLETKLYSPQPNPFVHKTKILFSLKNSAFAKLLIYDLTGRVAKTLVNGRMKSGVYTINWHGDDNSGKKLAKGIYFMKFETEDYQKIRKLLLVR